MKLLKKGGQKNLNILGKVTGEYEIKTFKGNQRIRSPIGPPFQPVRRSPNIKKASQNSDSNLGEMFYVDPNDSNFRRGQNMSPLNDSNNMNMNTRSPYKDSNYDYNYNYNRNKMMTIAPNNNRNYLGESPQELDYNMRSIPQMRNNNMNNLNNTNINSPQPQNNLTADRSYNMILNDTGNIFLDQPMQQVGYTNQTTENDRIITNPLTVGDPLNPVIRTDFQEPSPGN